MMIENEIDINLDKPIEKVLENKNLFKKCLDYCDIEDILNLSLVSNKFYKIIKENYDYKFEEEIEKNYFSNYNNYE